MIICVIMILAVLELMVIRIAIFYWKNIRIIL